MTLFGAAVVMVIDYIHMYCYWQLRAMYDLYIATQQVGLLDVFPTCNDCFGMCSDCSQYKEEGAILAVHV